MKMRPTPYAPLLMAAGALVFLTLCVCLTPALPARAQAAADAPDRRAAQTSAGADWPCYRADPARTAAAPKGLRFPLALAWVHQPAQPPRPAWPDAAWGQPGTRWEYNRVNFDDAPQPVVAGGRVYFGSSTDDSIRALDLATGERQWRFTTGGPVRFAPHIANNKCYVASDDGFVYCLRAATGELVWRFRAAPEDDRILGNGRMISRWPLRTGVLVVDRTAYVTAGMWPSEGVYVYSLNADTGEVIWRNDTSGAMYMPQPHSAYAMTGVAPQGYLLAARDVLLVPTGRALPAAYDRRTGRLLYQRHSEKNGGVWAAVDERRGLFFNGHEAQRDGILAYSLATGDVVTKPDCSFVPDACARAGDTLFGGQQDLVRAESNGEEIWRHDLQGRARALAVADGRLVVATTKGLIYCFQSGEEPATWNRPVARGADKTSQAADATPEPAGLADLLQRIEQARITKGYALVVGQPDARLAEALASRTPLHVISVLRDESIVALERARLLGATRLYGSRLTVHHVNADSGLPYAPYFANVLAVSGRGDGLPAKDLYRVLRPCGGVLLFHQAPSSLIDKVLNDADVPPAEVRSDAGSTYIRRGKLPGAFDWDSEVTCDQRVKWPLELLWFGGPGPASVASRDVCGAPRAANGRYFILGSGDRVIAIDAYNGCELWSRKISELADAPARGPRSLAADDDHLYLNVGAVCHQLDAQTGALEKKMPLKQAPPWARQWGRLPRRSSADRQRLVSRNHPLTGQPGDKRYVRSAGCGGVVSSAAANFLRSGALGIYDFLDDSGLRNFGGVRPSCGADAGPTSLMPALGLLISSEGSLGCSCSYNFQCSLALVPAAARKNEDWAIFADPTDVLGGSLRRAALDLGAPGDRRDADGTLWLGFPRPAFATGPRGRKMSLGVPFHVAPEDAVQTYRFNADRVVVGGTDRPWIYASGYRGLTKAVLDLAICDEGTAALSLACHRPPAVDGRPLETCWEQGPRIPLLDGHASVRLRHDDDNLYIAYQCVPEMGPSGRSRPWNAETKGRDAPIWNDDAFEVYLKDQRSPTVLHVGVSASGARYDGLWRCAFDIPRLDEIAVDGDPDDWRGRGFRVNVFDAATCHLGWDDDGLLLLIKATGESFARERHFTGLTFIAAKPGLDGFIQLNVSAKDRAYTIDHGPGESVDAVILQAAEGKAADAYVIEARFPWDRLKITPAVGHEVGLPLAFYHSTPPDAAIARDLVADLPGMARLRLASDPGPPTELDYGQWLRVYGIERANLVAREDADWNGRWSSSSQIVEGAFSAEMAVPWNTLTAMGFAKEALELKFDKTGQVRQVAPPRWNRAEKERYLPLSFQAPNKSARPYTVRLHFAEIDDVAPGQRVFDVKLQGETVLRNFDIIQTAGQKLQAVVKECKGILAKDNITLELVPKSHELTQTNVPLLSGLEIRIEDDSADIP